MGNILRTALKGYNKEEVLKKIDAFNVIIFGLQTDSISKSEAEKEAEKIMAEEMHIVFKGFNKEDTDKYLNELAEKIRNHR